MRDETGRCKVMLVVVVVDLIGVVVVVGMMFV